MSRKSNTYKEEEESLPELNPEEKKSKPKKEKVKNEVKPSAFMAFLRSEKLKQGFAFFLLVFAVFMLVAFVSYFFTWKQDQDKLYESWSEILFNPDLIVENWTGKFGALLSHQFMYNWFGVSSFVFVYLMVLTGLLILFDIGKETIIRVLKHSLFFMFWLPLFFSYIVGTKIFYLGGGFGYFLDQYFGSVLGTVGEGVLIVFAGLIYSLINFNIPINAWKESIHKSLEKKEEVVEEIPEVEPLVNRFKDEVVEPSPIVEEIIPTEPIAEVPVIAEEVTLPVVPEEPEMEIETPVEESAELEMEVTQPVEENLELTVEVEDTSQNEDILTEEETNDHLAEFGEYDPTLDLSDYQVPPIELLKDYGEGIIKVDTKELEDNKDKIVTTLRNYNIDIAKIKATVGPTITLYEIVPAAGVRISKIKNLEDDIALSLAALGIRIIAPIPGKGTIGIEVPNKNADTVSMKSVIMSERFQTTTADLPIVLGKTISNETFVADLAKMPHLLMAGATGQGKSVGLNCILVSLLYKKHPSQVKFVLVDPKKVELTLFNKIERHFLAKLPDSAEAIITDNKKVIHTINSLCIEMDDRYELLKEAGVRQIKEYNAKFIQRRLNPEKGHRYLPYIVLVVDEFADLIMTAGKEVETPIARLAQLARAIGIHLIIATQRPSVNVITGTIKANFPARIAFRVMSKIDSRTILDAGGADQLIGRGDMLISLGSELTRIQCAFVDTPEVEAINNFIGEQRGYPTAFLLPEYVGEEGEGGGEDMDPSERDSMFDEAAKIVVISQQGSASLLQRKLKIGYNRAGRLIDQLEAAGIVGPFEGSKARSVNYNDVTALEQFLKGQGGNNNSNF